MYNSCCQFGSFSSDFITFLCTCALSLLILYKSDISCEEVKIKNCYQPKEFLKMAKQGEYRYSEWKYGLVVPVGFWHCNILLEHTRAAPFMFSMVYCCEFSRNCAACKHLYNRLWHPEEGTNTYFNNFNYNNLLCKSLKMEYVILKILTS